MTCQILRSVLGVCLTERNQGLSVKGSVIIIHSKAPRKGRYQKSALRLAATLGACLILVIAPIHMPYLPLTDLYAKEHV
jgi:hypothetical protein